ncbi:hypothetical protein MEN41_17290 [Dolichospermum sp. ST_con]|nr:hypothetical protein [Dolichospermum sp. ST_con]MDD1419051.1 hypothetical protein [Dolichospermum sp. ST_sed1]MDD1437415.1 hypothetical protein [Dolichospermum sp. ST_sed10]MDD1440812.1 hypothetical protein [Dolichospermum sp. ST_sed3]MDD1468014.1 hypothetical protein [Dolichospermum sp. ST_sed5]
MSRNKSNFVQLLTATMSPNPFFPGKPVPPEHFIGRTSEVNFAFDQICNRSHFAIWGDPGMGKTSFLKKLASEQALVEHGINPSQAYNCTAQRPRY